MRRRWRRHLAKVLPGINVADLTKRLSDRDRHFVWIQRGLTPRQKQAVFELGLEGLRFEEERGGCIRAGKLAGHFIGFTNVDGKGVEGAEAAFDGVLKSGGEPLRLTIDAGVQFVLEEELDKAYADFDMKGGAGVVLDAQTGAVRAIASWPAIDPNRPGDRSEHRQAQPGDQFAVRAGLDLQAADGRRRDGGGRAAGQRHVQRVPAVAHRRFDGARSASAAESAGGDAVGYSRLLLEHRRGADRAAPGFGKRRRNSWRRSACWSARPMTVRRRRRR